MKQRCIRIYIRIFQEQHDRLMSPGPPKVGKAHAKLRISNRHLFHIQRVRIFGRCIRLPTHACMEHNGLVILDAQVIERLQLLFIRKKFLLGRMQLQAAQLQNAEGIFKHFCSIRAMRIYTGKTHKPFRGQINQLAHFFIRYNPAAAYRSQIKGKQHRPGYPVVIHFLQHIFDGSGRLLEDAEFPFPVFQRLFLIADRFKKYRMCVNINNQR
ncbi:hypothetical protein D3C75_608600 [compost metagenome]